MSRTASNMIPLNSIASNFNLLDTISGDFKNLNELKGKKGTVIFFICNHCPFVIHVNDELIRMAEDFTSKGIGFIAISSNDVEDYPQDRPSLMKVHALELGYPFPYLYDESQDVAKAYDAACTPDCYLFDSELKLVYRGQLDDSRPGNEKSVTGIDVRHAVDCLLNHMKNEQIQKPSIGCNIKWKN